MAWNAQRRQRSYMARRNRKQSQSRPAVDPLMQRVRRLRRRGEERKVLVTLRQACHGHGRDPKLWALYGVQCFRSGNLQDAERALSQAVWHHTKNDEPRKAESVRRVLEQLRLRAA